MSFVTTRCRLPAEQSGLGVVPGQKPLEPLKPWPMSWRPVEVEGPGSGLRSTPHLLICPQWKTGDAQACLGDSRAPTNGSEWGHWCVMMGVAEAGWAGIEGPQGALAF